jgi:hypothetical protein
VVDTKETLVPPACDSDEKHGWITAPPVSASHATRMTLNLTIVNPFGVWQCSDHRLTDPATWKSVDDHSIKHVIFRCPDGSALLAYAGAGRIGTVDLSDWIRESLRGETRTLDETFIQIRENATRDLAPLLHAPGILHMFSIGAFVAGRPWVVQIRNFIVQSGLPPGPALNRFDTVAKEITGQGQGFMFGDPGAFTSADLTRLTALATKKPRRPKDFRGLLASLNLRAAATESGRITISPGCVTTYMPPAGEPFESEFHNEADSPAAPLTVPILLFGVDMTEMQRALMTQLPASPGSTSQSGSSLQQETERAGKKSVTPRNRLRR